MTRRRWKKEPIRLVPRKELPKPLEGLDALRDLDSRDTRAEFLEAIGDRQEMVQAGQLKPLGQFDPAIAGVTLPSIASRMGGGGMSSGAATDRGWMPATRSNSPKSKPASRFVPDAPGARVYNDGLDDLGAYMPVPSNSTIRDILDNRF